MLKPILEHNFAFSEKKSKWMYPNCPWKHTPLPYPHSPPKKNPREKPWLPDINLLSVCVWGGCCDVQVPTGGTWLWKVQKYLFSNFTFLFFLFFFMKMVKNRGQSFKFQHRDCNSQTTQEIQQTRLDSCVFAFWKAWNRPKLEEGANLPLLNGKIPLVLIQNHVTQGKIYRKLPLVGKFPWYCVISWASPTLHLPLVEKGLTYTLVHLVESVENCGLCMRRYLACSSYANVIHRELAITRALHYDASTRD